MMARRCPQHGWAEGTCHHARLSIVCQAQAAAQASCIRQPVHTHDGLLARVHACVRVCACAGGAVAVARLQVCAVEALSLMQQHAMSALAVVSPDSGRILGNFAICEMRCAACTRTHLHAREQPRSYE